jgi:tripartite-type tricarboxylate transporter receptor subunit TctC
MKKLHWLVVVLAFFAAAKVVDAQPYPNRPIRLVVPFPAGGAADLAARTVTQALSQALGQSLIIDNRGGAAGAIAGDVVKTSPPDGYTLLFATTTGLNAAPVMRKQPPYDPITAFTPIALVGKFGFFLFVHSPAYSGSPTGRPSAYSPTSRAGGFGTVGRAFSGGGS